MTNAKPRTDAHRLADKRRREAGKRKPQVSVEFSQTEMDQIDRKRGEIPRATFIRSKVLDI